MEIDPEFIYFLPNHLGKTGICDFSDRVFWSIFFPLWKKSPGYKCIQNETKSRYIILYYFMQIVAI